MCLCLNLVYTMRARIQLQGGLDIMKIKAMALLLSIIMLSSGVCFSVAAASVAKTAKLHNVKVTINGIEKTIQCYNIDDYNYVRIRDVAAPLDMYVEAMAYEGTQTGVKILSYKNYEGSPTMEHLTEQSISVAITKENLYYDGIPTEVERFNYGNHNYYKLADIAKACENSLTLLQEAAIRDGNYINGTLRTYDLFRTITVKWNPETHIVECNSSLVDLAEIAKETRAIALSGSTSADNGTEQDRMNELFTPRFLEINSIIHLHKPMPPMTSPPEDGEILAKILIDPARGAYWNGDSTKGWLGSNITDSYLTNGSFGECTWYAIGRFAEVNGINLMAIHPNIYEPREMATKSEQLLSFSPNYLSAPPRSVMVWKGHIAFLEYVERDTNGTITAVYISEANAGTGGVYTYEQDGMVHKHTYAQFMDRAKDFIGYISLK